MVGFWDSIRTVVHPHSASTCRPPRGESIRRRFLIRGLILPYLLTALQVCAAAEPSAALRGIVDRYPHLRLDDPREFPMKLRSVLSDPYTFFRGTTDVFYDYCRKNCADWLADRTYRVRLHGDIHIGNVGVYQSLGEPGKDIRFGVVDLDETVEGPFQLDLLRALTSVRFAAASLNTPLDDEAARNVARALTTGYAECLSGHVSYDDVVSRSAPVVTLRRKASKNSKHEFVADYATRDSIWRFRRARIKSGKVKDLLEPVDADTRASIVEGVWGYIKRGPTTGPADSFRFVTSAELNEGVTDVVRWTRIGSSGSQGVHKLLVLLDRPLRGNDDAMILELKEQPVPAAARVGAMVASRGPERAAEVAQAYQRLLSAPPRLVGYAHIGDRGFLVVPKDPWNEELELKDFLSFSPGERFIEMARLLGEAIGLAHREWLLPSGSGASVESVLKALEGLDAPLIARSTAIEQLLRTEFDSLKNDPACAPHIEAAEALIQSARQ
jgi:uncharacterized protein (DUF2252 family)